jgi:hypothetical protein
MKGEKMKDTSNIRQHPEFLRGYAEGYKVGWIKGTEKFVELEIERQKLGIYPTLIIEDSDTSPTSNIADKDHERR